MKSKAILMVIFCFTSLFLAQESKGVAFKMKNDSKYHLRVRCYDRGQWRQWVTFQPGGWGDFAASVKRREHSIEVQIWDGQQWKPLYYNHHGSRLFTRVVQVYSNQQGNIYFIWWDEPPGCRDAPPYPGSGRSTCLKPSGWLRGQLWNYARKIGMAFVVGG